MAKLRVRSTSELATGGNWSVLLYGDNRAGKTYFSSTWPFPVFLVPRIVEDNEMRTLSEWDMPFIPFGDFNDFQEQVEGLVHAIKMKRPVGPYVPRTVVIDNMTTAQMMWEEDLKAEANKQRLDWDDWGRMKSLTQRALVELSKVDVHQIWITHAKVWRGTTTKQAGGRSVTTEDQGGFTLQGSTREMLPNHCDLLLYCEQVDRGARGPGWVVHGRKKDIWPAGVRLSRIHKDKPFTKIGPEPSPTYDDLAPYLGLETLAEIEGEGAGGAGIAEEAKANNQSHNQSQNNSTSKGKKK